MNFRSILAGAAAAAAMTIAAAPVAEAMTVQPVVVDLQAAGRNMAGSVRVENDGTQPLPVEVRITETDFSNNTVTASDRPSEDIMAFPPQAIIPPGQTQVFRLQYLGDPDIATSKHYYATIAQLPVELPEGQSSIQILYNFQVMTNVASPTAAPPDLSVVETGIGKDEQGRIYPTFNIRNAGGNYTYLANTRLTIAQKDGLGKEIFRRVLSPNDIQQTIGYGLIGPQTTRNFRAPIELPTDQGTIEVSIAKGD